MTPDDEVTDVGVLRVPPAVDVSQLVERLAQAGQTVAAAESLTAGLVTATLTEVAGASQVVRGGVTVYHCDLKTSVAGVDPALLARGGPVQAEVAGQLARGAARLFGATWGIGTTGVAGPGPADGHEAGTVFVAVAGPDGVHVRELALTGDRAAVRVATVTAVLGILGGRCGL